MPKTVPLSDFFHQETLRSLRETLQRLQYYYTQRDVKLLDAFMAELFSTEGSITVIGVGDDAFCAGHDQAREMFENDWLYWGDVVFDSEPARIDYHNEVGWITTTGTVTKRLDTEILFRDVPDKTQEVDERKNSILNMLKLTTDVSNNDSGGQVFSMGIRFSAVLLKTSEGWRFKQMHFSTTTP